MSKDVSPEDAMEALITTAYMAATAWPDKTFETAAIRNKKPLQALCFLLSASYVVAEAVSDNVLEDFEAIPDSIKSILLPMLQQIAKDLNIDPSSTEEPQS
jgi:hypothetical protein